MPLLYLREVEPFLPSDQTAKMEENIRVHYKKEAKKRNRSEGRGSKRSTSLIVSDTLIACCELLQILGLIQSMSLRWTWPETWIKNANFILLFNMDAWDFVKVQSGAYRQLQGQETLSSTIPVSYNYILLAWFLFVVVVGAIFLTVYIILERRQPPYLMVHKAKMERVFLILVQVLAIPTGTVLFRLFQCTDLDKMAVFDDIDCHEGLHWAYFVPALLGIIAIFIVVPAWMVYRIRSQKLAAASPHHESYMKLKEVEYMAGLDVVWAVQGYSLFSSFRLPAAFYRPIVMLAKLGMLIVFAAAYSSIYTQALAFTLILCLLALLLPLVRPFRVMSFNVVLCIALCCLIGNALVGTMIAQQSPAEVESPWLVEPFSWYILVGVNAIFVLTLLCWAIFMISRQYCCHSCFPNDPLWPIMMSYGYEVEGKETYKFMAAVLRGRSILDSCIRAPMVFAPVHQLARQIEIINAFCREAEMTKDGLHTTLLQLLDDMTDIYRRLEPVSLFAETVRENIRLNAAFFVELMPAFAQRLAQRDYDLLLTRPLKKRLLLKMYIVSMFKNVSKKKPVTDTITQGALLKIWQEAPERIDPKSEVEYAEELYPEPLTGPDAETLYLSGTVDRPLELMDLDDSDEEESLSMFLSRVPPVLMMKDEQSRSGSVVSLAGPPDAMFQNVIMVQQASTSRAELQPQGDSLEGPEQGFMNPGYIPDGEELPKYSEVEEESVKSLKKEDLAAADAFRDYPKTGETDQFPQPEEEDSAVASEAAAELEAIEELEAATAAELEAAAVAELEAAKAELEEEDKSAKTEAEFKAVEELEEATVAELIATELEEDVKSARDETLKEVLVENATSFSQPEVDVSGAEGEKAEASTVSDEIQVRGQEEEIETVKSEVKEDVENRAVAEPSAEDDTDASQLELSEKNISEDDTFPPGDSHV